MQHRNEARIAAGKPATATILGNPDVSVPCQIVNFSASGMCIMTRQPIEMDHAVKVDWDGHFLVGRVRRTDTERSGCRIGLKLLYCSQWKGAPEPELAHR
jgi:hypothetical protein